MAAVRRTEGGRAWPYLAACIGLAVIGAGAPDGSMAAPDRSDRETCLSASAEAAVAACRRVLAKNAGDTDARLALGEALTRLNRYQEAVESLRHGLQVSPADSRIEKKLQLAESYLQEQKWIEERSQRSAPGASAKPDVALQLERVRCTSLTGEQALKACDKALQLAPDDPSLHRAKGDALLALDRVGRAIPAYREALRLDPSNPAATQALERAQLRQKKYLTDCRATSGESALKACDLARIAGAADEPAIHVRRGELLLEMNRTAEAEQAFETALKLDPANPQAAARLAALRRPKEPVQPVASAPDTKPKTATQPPIPAQQASRPQPTGPQFKTSRTEVSRRYSNVPPVAGITH